MKACWGTRAARFTGYRLLHEYFTFPDKFFFVDLTGLEAALAGGFKDRAEPDLF